MTFDFVEPVIFALLSIGVIAGGVAVVMLSRITAAALLMAFTFLCMAGMFVLLGAETIALFQVLIYVGAITVLILYGVMFTKFGDRPRALFFQRRCRGGHPRRRPLARVPRRRPESGRGRPSRARDQRLHRLRVPVRDRIGPAPRRDGRRHRPREARG
ncbi:MAG: hypothetical protein E6J13_14765 [Chloroflexi bacterium]|nr:MAG: hypothetical protein E6J13_14765 [Chloroflexota bacterium]